MIKAIPSAHASLWVDKQRAEQNIKRMLHKAEKHNVQFRPHYKTHQSDELDRLFQVQGIKKITVASLEMAKQFVLQGAKDVLVAILFNPLEVEALVALSKKAWVGILIDSKELLPFLTAYPDTDFHVHIKIDCGYGRSGMDVQDAAKVLRLSEAISSHPHLKLEGLVAHFGNTYSAGSSEEIRNIYNDGIRQLNTLRTQLRSEGYSLQISIGDTPSLSIMESWEGFEEARPGNFVYYDWMQYQLGSCSLEDIAALAVCPVLARYPERNEIVIHGGAIHLSKEHALENGLLHFGRVVSLKEGFNTKAIDGAYVKKLSQEHGTLHMPDAYFDKFPLGSQLGIIPIHSCLTANLLKNNTFII